MTKKIDELSMKFAINFKMFVFFFLNNYYNYASVLQKV